MGEVAGGPRGTPGASGFPLPTAAQVRQHSPSQLCPGGKMAEIRVKNSEGYQNRTRGKSVTIMYEII